MFTVGPAEGRRACYHLFREWRGSVHFVREGDAWQFFILPGTDLATHEVAAFPMLSPLPSRAQSPVASISRVPSLGVPMENLVWDVILPPGMELTREEGDLEPRATEQRGLFE